MAGASTAPAGSSDRPFWASPSVLYDGENVLLADDQQILAFHLELGAGVLRVQDLLTLFHVDLLALPVIEKAARTDGEDRSLLGLLLRGVRENEPRLGRLLARRGLDDAAIAQRAKLGRSGSGQRASLLRQRPRPTVGLNLMRGEASG